MPAWMACGKRKTPLPSFKQHVCVAAMPQLTFAYPQGQGCTAQGWDRPCKWMEDIKKDGVGESAKRSREPQWSSNQTSADVKSHQKSWSQVFRTLRPWTGWYSFAPVGVIWSICQAEVLLHPCLLEVDVCWSFLLVCLLWMVLGGCVHALKCCLRSEQNQEGAPQRIQEEIVAETRNDQDLWLSQSKSPRLSAPLALVLVDGLLLCVLQEPLPDPSVPHIQALLSRLESVSHTLRKADTLEELDRESTLTDKVKLIRIYLKQRMRSLRTLVKVQGDFEVSVKDILEVLDGLWAQLEELHTGVTLTKEGGRGHRDLAEAQTGTENLSAVLSHYRNKLQSCQAYLRDSTELMQELTWSHTHMSNNVSSSCESVWPELLLQSNIEQFDKVQESFLSLEQQTCTFQAHLEGLGKGTHEGHGRALTHANGAHFHPVFPQFSPQLHDLRGDVSLEHHNTTSAPSVNTDTETLSLCERSALHFTSTIGRLRKSGRKK
ncbi:uncharacterized protein LOC113134893 [Mastacembelus armatus]|uniref:uncharacterized protein LOC113134893 n=1 Tax=Mastacembelus armatus TaxID=205130 RepID=UPI000E45A34B|nr:uncharacterized protein LOC113134893 [Mastacembelus armatus]